MPVRRSGRSPRATERPNGRGKSVTLKELAHSLKLSPSAVSFVLNRAPAADSIPAETKARVFAAAREMDYRPNYLARSLRSRRSYSVGVMVPEISEPYATEVMSGIEAHLLQEGYHYLVTSHRRSSSDLLEDNMNLLEHRAVEGLILIAAELREAPRLPAVVVSGHIPLAGVTNVIIDHDRAAALTLDHLIAQGHERIAFFKGQPGSADTEDRWRAILSVAAARGLTIHPQLTLQLSGDAAGEVFSPADGFEEGYTFGRKLLAAGAPFTALFAFDDVSAIGATRAFLDADRRIPQDISVVGFDDIQSAAFQNPRLTTVRQPLREMGEIAARILLRRIAAQEVAEGELVTVQPELVIRDSTGPAPATRRAGG